MKLNKAQCGYLGGKSRSPKKIRAARRNGKQGGRPQPQFTLRQAGKA